MPRYQVTIEVDHCTDPEDARKWASVILGMGRTGQVQECCEVCYKLKNCCKCGEHTFNNV